MHWQKLLQSIDLSFWETSSTVAGVTVNRRLASTPTQTLRVGVEGPTLFALLTPDGSWWDQSWRHTTPAASLTLPPSGQLVCCTATGDIQWVKASSSCFFIINAALLKHLIMLLYTSFYFVSNKKRTFLCLALKINNNRMILYYIICIWASTTNDRGQQYAIRTSSPPTPKKKIWAALSYDVVFRGLRRAVWKLRGKHLLKNNQIKRYYVN